MFHFFVTPSQMEGNQIRINGADYNHGKNVIRLKEKDEVLISVGDKNHHNVNYLCSVQGYTEEELICSIISSDVAGTELPCRITLYQGLPKADKMELIIQKAVELGVFDIVPVAMKRCIVKLEDKKEEQKLKRWNLISESAAKQSKRTIIPQIRNSLTFRQAVEEGKKLDMCLVPYENQQGMKATRTALEAIKPGFHIGIFIGPEGGFEEEEIELAKANGMQTISLGKRILRTETAGLSALAMITYAVEDKE